MISKNINMTEKVEKKKMKKHLVKMCLEYLDYRQILGIILKSKIQKSLFEVNNITYKIFSELIRFTEYNNYNLFDSYSNELNDYADFLHNLITQNNILESEIEKAFFLYIDYESYLRKKTKIIKIQFHLESGYLLDFMSKLYVRGFKFNALEIKKSDIEKLTKFSINHPNFLNSINNCDINDEIINSNSVSLQEIEIDYRQLINNDFEDNLINVTNFKIINNYRTKFNEVNIINILKNIKKFKNVKYLSLYFDDEFIFHNKNNSEKLDKEFLISNFKNLEKLIIRFVHSHVNLFKLHITDHPDDYQITQFNQEIWNFLLIPKLKEVIFNKFNKYHMSDLLSKFVNYNLNHIESIYISYENEIHISYNYDEEKIIFDNLFQFVSKNENITYLNYSNSNCIKSENYVNLDISPICSLKVDSNSFLDLAVELIKRNLKKEIQNKFKVGGNTFNFLDLFKKLLDQNLIQFFSKVEEITFELSNANLEYSGKYENKFDEDKKTLNEILPYLKNIEKISINYSRQTEKILDLFTELDLIKHLKCLQLDYSETNDFDSINTNNFNLIGICNILEKFHTMTQIEEINYSDYNPNVLLKFLIENYKNYPKLKRIIWNNEIDREIFLDLDLEILSNFFKVFIKISYYEFEFEYEENEMDIDEEFKEVLNKFGNKIRNRQ